MANPAPAHPQDPKRILIVRPSALGDVARTVPVLASLRSAYPAAEIDWLVQDAFAAAISHHPALSRVIPFARARFGSELTRFRPGPILAWLNQLKTSRYDLVIDCQGLARSGIFTWWTRARRRVGYANAQEGAWFAYNVRRHVDRNLHAVDRMLALVDSAGVPVIRDMRLYADPHETHARLNDPVLAEGRYVVVAPTSRWLGKRWPEERFAAAIQALLDSGVQRVVLVGAPSERPQCQRLATLASSEPRIVDRIGSTSVAALMALVEGSSLVLCNDSAVLHMAVGFSRPIVALYGPTHVARVGPYLREKDVIQHVREHDRIDHKDDAAGTELMSRISVEEVVAAVQARLPGPGQTPHPGPAPAEPDTPVRTDGAA